MNWICPVCMFNLKTGTVVGSIVVLSRRYEKHNGDGGEGEESNICFSCAS